jgi:hypothetical protein
MTTGHAGNGPLERNGPATTTRPMSRPLRGLIRRECSRGIRCGAVLGGDQLRRIPPGAMDGLKTATSSDFMWNLLCVTVIAVSVG